MCKATITIIAPSKGNIRIKKMACENLDSAILMAERITRNISNKGVFLHAKTTRDGLVGYYKQEF